jgi:uncharacterized protein (DUF1684 family)
MENDYQAIRLEKDTFFAQDSLSPLTKTQKKDFKGLNYFAPDEALRLTLELHPLAQPAAMKCRLPPVTCVKFTRSESSPSKLMANPRD